MGFGYSGAQECSAWSYDHESQHSLFRVNISRVVEFIRKVYKDGTSKQEADLVVKGGRKIPFEFTAALLKDGSGNVLGFLDTGRDLAERKRMEEENMKALKEAQIFCKASMFRESHVLELKAEVEQLRKDLGRQTSAVNFWLNESH